MSCILGKTLTFYFVILCAFCGLGFKGRDAVPGMVKAYLDKKVKLDEFITHKLTLEQVNDAIEMMKTGKWYVYTPVLSPPFRYINKCTSVYFCYLYFHSIRTVLNVSPE